MSIRSGDTPPNTVLVVDDEAEIRELLTEVLAAHGYAVETAGTAGAGLEAARARRPSVVLLDLGLPGALSGDAAIEAFAHLAPVVVITAEDDPRTVQRARQHGAVDYLTKPFNLERLRTVVAAAVARGPAQRPADGQRGS